MSHTTTYLIFSGNENDILKGTYYDGICPKSGFTSNPGAEYLRELIIFLAETHLTDCVPTKKTDTRVKKGKRSYGVTSNRCNS